MSTLHLPSPAVSAHWLAHHLHHPQLMVFDASMAWPGKDAITAMEVQIGDAQFFDINDIRDQHNPLPHMMPSAEQFTSQVQALGVNQDSVIIIYDDKGVYSSARAWWMFKSMGCKQVAVLDGGLPAWQKDGYEVNRAIKVQSRPKGNFIATYLESSFCDVQRVLSGLSDPRINVLDARSAARFEGIEPDPRPHVRSGHMPGALNLHFAELFETVGLHAGLLKPKEEIKEIFHRISPHHRALILTCGSGVTACILALAAVIANYTELSVYDGSWSEWGSRTDCPIVYS